MSLRFLRPPADGLPDLRPRLIPEDDQLLLLCIAAVAVTTAAALGLMWEMPESPKSLHLDPAVLRRIRPLATPVRPTPPAALAHAIPTPRRVPWLEFKWPPAAWPDLDRRSVSRPTTECVCDTTKLAYTHDPRAGFRLLLVLEDDIRYFPPGTRCAKVQSWWVSDPDATIADGRRRRRFAQQHFADVRTCLEGEPLVQPTGQMRGHLHVAVSSSGEVTSSVLQTDQALSESTHVCIEEAYRRRLPPIAPQPYAFFSYPLTFKLTCQESRRVQGSTFGASVERALSGLRELRPPAPGDIAAPKGDDLAGR